MLDQLSFVGIDAVPRPTDGVFFAIIPDADAAESAARLARHLRGEHGLTGKPLEMERLHVTLCHLGNYMGLPQGIVAAAGEAAAAVAMPPLDVVFDHAMSFSGRPGNRPFVLCGSDGAAALMAFQQSLGTQ